MKQASVTVFVGVLDVLQSNLGERFADQKILNEMIGLVGDLENKFDQLKRVDA